MVAKTSIPIRLNPAHVGVVECSKISPGALELCNELLDQNHGAYHIFYQDPAFHNHMVHSLLTTMTLGASTDEIHDRFNDLAVIQRAIPEIDEKLLEALNDDETFYQTIGQIHQYHTFLEFFKIKIAAKGYQNVVLEYVFSHSKVADRMLVQMVEGAYHPIIHLGLGIEFDQPAVVAEALAQAASHDRMNIETVLFDAEQKASARGTSASGTKSLIQLMHHVRLNDSIRTAAKWSDLGQKMKNGIVGRVGDQMAEIASQFYIKSDSQKELDRRTAEMISVCAYVAGSAHKEGRKRKIDFFIMHSVTSSIFCTIVAKQSWIPLADRCRLVDFKARTDLMWYAATGSAVLDPNAISHYKEPQSDDMSWEDLFTEVRRECDDGHAAKFIRALKNGEVTAKQYEQTNDWADYFPCQGSSWLKLARLCRDTTRNTPWEQKWVFFTGFEEGWKRPDLAGPPQQNGHEQTNGLNGHSK